MHEQNIYYIADLENSHQMYVNGLMNQEELRREKFENNLFETWRSKIKEDDIVYIWGYSNGEKIYIGYLDRIQSLPGHKHLIVNQDAERLNEEQNREMLSIFESIFSYKKIMDNGREVTLTSYQMKDWPGREKGTWHVHAKSNYLPSSDKDLSASIIRNKGIPVTLDEMYDTMQKKYFETEFKFLIEEHTSGYQYYLRLYPKSSVYYGETMMNIQGDVCYSRIQELKRENVTYYKFYEAPSYEFDSRLFVLYREIDTMLRENRDFIKVDTYYCDNSWMIVKDNNNYVFTSYSLFGGDGFSFILSKERTIEFKEFLENFVNYMRKYSDADSGWYR